MNKRYERADCRGRAAASPPAILLFVFAGIWFYDRSCGGFRAQKL